MTGQREGKRGKDGYILVRNGSEQVSRPRTSEVFLKDRVKTFQLQSVVVRCLDGPQKVSDTASSPTPDTASCLCPSAERLLRESELELCDVLLSNCLYITKQIRCQHPKKTSQPPSADRSMPCPANNLRRRVAKSSAYFI